MRSPLTATAVTLALLGSGMYASPATAAPPTDDRVVTGELRPQKKPKQSPTIVSPKPQQSVSRHTTRIIVRAPHGIRRAQLNTTRLRNNEFTLDADGARRVMTVSSSHGLKHGDNTLRITINKRYKGTVTKIVRFRVTGKQLLAGAGRERRVAAGSGVTLNGTARLHPSMRDRSTRHRWKIVHKPIGSSPVLLRPNSRKPRLKTDVPGRYVVRNTATMGRAAAAAGNTTSDTATVNAASAPMVSFDAWSEDSAGNLGITVDGRFYPGHLPLEFSAWQLLILDRTTLGVDEGDNRTYSWVAGDWYVATEPTATAQQMRKANLAAELGELGPNQLVVLVHRTQFGQTIRDNTAFVKALNIPKEALPVGDQSAAIVSVPGKNGGVHTYMRDTAGKADLSGYLMQDRNFHYTFVDDARVPFDTRSSQKCDTSSCTVTVTVGGEDSGLPQVERTFTATNGRSGLGILRFDRRTLAFRDSQYVLTNGTSPDNTRDVMIGVTAYLKSLPDDDLVLITSVTAPGVALMSKPSPQGRPTADGQGLWVENDPVTEMAAQIARLGGTTHRFLQAGVAPDDGYTLVGYPGLEEGQGNESHAKQARLSGVLERDSAQMFTPKTVSPGAQNYDTLTATMMRAPGQRAWWRANDPAFMAVFQCLAQDKEGMDKKNPRLTYWNSIKTIKTETWNTWYTDVKRADVSECPGTDPALFKDARNTFASELLLVYRLYRYTDVLKQPYGDSAAVAALADVSKWSSELKANSDEVKSRNVSIDWFDLIATALEVVAPFLAGYLGDSVKKAAEKLVEEATHALAAAIAGSIEFSVGKVESTETGEKYLEDDEFNVEVGKLGSEVVSRLQTTVGNLDAMKAVIAADYSKLSAIGEELAKCSADSDANRLPGTPQSTCDPSFFIYGKQGDITVAKAEASASHTAERTIYEKVLPLTFPMSRIPWNGVRTQGNGTPEGNWNGKLFTCYVRTPFPDSWPDEALPFLRRSLGSVHEKNKDYLIGFDGFDERAGYTTPQFDVYVISQGNNRYNIATAEETVERLFGENVDSTDPAAGGLGADPVDYILSQTREGKIVEFPLGCGGFSSENTEPAPLDR